MVVHPPAKVFGTWASRKMRISALLVHGASNLAGSCIGSRHYYRLEHLFGGYVVRQSGNIAFSGISRSTNFWGRGYVLDISRGVALLC